MAGDSGASEDEANVEDPFALVGNEIRAGIIQIFGEARYEQRSRPELTFSELREAVDRDVRSSQFNYHLQQLVGAFVEQTENGYRLRPEGHDLYKTLAAGTFARRSSPEEGKAGFNCHHCGTTVAARFEEGLVRIACPSCKTQYDVATIPPGAVDEGTVRLSDVARYNHHDHLAFARGICPTCGNSVETALLRSEESPFARGEDAVIMVHRGCPRCGDERYLSLGEALLADAGLVAFCHEHGLDVLETPLWELEFAATDRFVALHSMDPWRVSLTLSFEDETLELLVDGDLNILERNRSASE